jgi:DNA polymerase-3 subunit delta'
MNNIIGHNEIKSELKNAISNNTVSHAYIFEGIEGIGKLTLAKNFARILLCLEKSTEACGKCESCKIIDNHPDFQIIDSEKGSIKVDQIRQLGLSIALKPIASERKVYIINNAENMTEEAQNALLKVLEEPPTYATIIIITSNKEKLLKTIKSRCSTLRFNGLSQDDINKYFNNESINEHILKYARGSIGKIIELKNKNYFDTARNLKDALDKKDLLLINKQVSGIISDKDAKENVIEILDYLIFLYFSVIKENYIKHTNCIEIIESTKQDLKRNANAEIALNAMVLWLIEK